MTKTQFPTMPQFIPKSEEQLIDIIADKTNLDGYGGYDLTGRGSKSFFGQLPLNEKAEMPLARLELSHLSGIKMYEPEELVMTIAAATPMDEINHALTQHQQNLAFAPPDWRWMGGKAAMSRQQTAGGIVAGNLSGSERLKMGAVRDHVLGFRGVNGRGELIKSGGRVVKNVTGYDLSKLISGSFGSLAALTEISFKIWPVAESEQTLMVAGLTDSEASQFMAVALNSPHDVHCAAHVPAHACRQATHNALRQSTTSQTLLRISGYRNSVAPRLEALRLFLVEQVAGLAGKSIEKLTESGELWRELSDGRVFAALYDADRLGEDAIWRISMAPQTAPKFMAALAESLPRDAAPIWYYDWGGGLVWLYLHHMNGNAAGNTIRRILAEFAKTNAGGGHATLLAAKPSLRRQNLVFEPLSPAQAQLVARIKHSFDPNHCLNPGRIYPNI